MSQHIEFDEIKKVYERFMQIKESAHPSYTLWGKTGLDYVEVCNELEALGLKWGDQLCPRRDFYIGRGSSISPVFSSDLDKDIFYVVWDNNNAGRMQFASGEYYHCIADEWKEFWAKLLSYNPIDCDYNHCRMVFDIENGKRLMSDYEGICENTQKKCLAKIKKEKIKRLRDELADLKKNQKDSR